GFTEVNLFGKYNSNGQPKSQQYYEKVEEDDNIFLLFLEPLKNTSGMNASQGNENKRIFSRHSVLHGESLDYGNHVEKSLKALSLLYYTANIVERMKRRQNR